MHIRASNELDAAMRCTSAAVATLQTGTRIRVLREIILEVLVTPLRRKATHIDIIVVALLDFVRQIPFWFLSQHSRIETHSGAAW